MIALISEAVSVNVSASYLFSGSDKSFHLSLLCKWSALDGLLKGGNSHPRPTLTEGEALSSLSGGADCDVWCVQAAVQRFETLAGRSAMVSV